MTKKKKVIMTRKDAITSGKEVYFTGKPCLHGHLVNRYTSTGHCIECLKLRGLSERAAVKAGRVQAAAHG
ncbi:hypothetical protein UFOVP136_2 [uncultured Caudovirales phage]|uniref:Uncharacterized protein n=1 Tax=uncultured Caudovirales phage TaxID=2100421 RepID=A0A6J5LBN8_9CAUD|nr:hypothetical protein UFOVP136_2 [uncultured Caudovirales phage]